MTCTSTTVRSWFRLTVIAVALVLSGSAWPGAGALAQDGEHPATATEAARRFVAAVQAHDEAAVLRSLPPDQREEFTEEGIWYLLVALTVHDWKIVDTTGSDRRADVIVVWTTDYDVVAAIDGRLDHARRVFTEQGLAADEIEQRLERAAELVRDEAEGFGRVVNGDRVAIEMHRDDDGRWWVSDIEAVDPHDEASPADPGESHEEAEWTVRMYLRAVQAHNEDRMVALVDPEHRERFRTDGDLTLMQSLTVHRFQVAGCQANPDTGELQVTVDWSASLDEARYVELAVAIVRGFLEAQGMGPGQVEEAIKAARGSLVERAAKMRSEVKGSQLFTLVLHHGCWYVAGMEPSPDANVHGDPEGAETAEQAFTRAMEAIATGNPSAMLPVLTPGARDRFGEQDYGEALAAITLTRYEMVSIEESGDDDDPAVTVTFRWDATIDREKMQAWVVARQLQTYRRTGMDEETLNQLREQIVETARLAVADMEASFAADEQQMELEVIDGRYHVHQPFAVTPPEDGNDEDE